LDAQRAVVCGEDSAEYGGGRTAAGIHLKKTGLHHSDNVSQVQS
jgi:hypothetical protein